MIELSLSTVRFSVLVGLVIGAVWAFQGIGGALVCALVTLAAGVVGGLRSRGAVDLRAIVGRRDDD